MNNQWIEENEMLKRHLEEVDKILIKELNEIVDSVRRITQFCQTQKAELRKLREV